MLFSRCQARLALLLCTGILTAIAGPSGLSCQTNPPHEAVKQHASARGQWLDVANWTRENCLLDRITLLQRFFSGASIGSALSRTRSGECLAIPKRT
jgi:hypothetical protein